MNAVALSALASMSEKKSIIDEEEYTEDAPL